MLTSPRITFSISKGWRSLLAIAILLLALGSAVATQAQEPNRAGLVARHGDGTVIYALVQFEEESITGTQLLERSGIEIAMAPYGGMGGAVCSLDGEGCASNNCFCHSYSSPAFFWHYYVLSDGTWTEHPLGPASRDLSDGDVDGWSWTAGDSELPDTTIEDIEEISSPPTPTNAPVETAAAEQEPTSAAEPESRAVVVEPGESPTTLVADERGDAGSTDSYLIFATMAAVVVAAGGFALLRRRAAKS